MMTKNCCNTNFTEIDIKYVKYTKFQKSEKFNIKTKIFQKIPKNIPKTSKYFKNFQFTVLFTPRLKLNLDDFFSDLKIHNYKSSYNFPTFFFFGNII